MSIEMNYAWHNVKSMLFVTSLRPAGERGIGDVLIGLPKDDIFP